MMSHLLFTRKQRLLNQIEFDVVFKKAKKVSHPSVLMLFKPNSLSFARLGTIIGKRVAKKAVVRNQFKRVVRESFRMNQTRLQGLDIIVLARQQCDLLSKNELREVLETLWEKLLTFQKNSSFI